MPQGWGRRTHPEAEHDPADHPRTEHLHPAAATGTSPSASGRPLLPGRRWRRLVAALAFAGPGLIAANAGNDVGGIATYASVGAQFGYQTLFPMLLITVVLVVVQEMCARLGPYTGEGLGALIREQFSLRVTAFALLAFLVSNLGLVVSEFAGIAAALELVGVPKFAPVPVAALVIWGTGGLRLLPLRRARVPGAVAGVPGPPGRRRARLPRRVAGHRPAGT